MQSAVPHWGSRGKCVAIHAAIKANIEERPASGAAERPSPRAPLCKSHVVASVALTCVPAPDRRTAAAREPQGSWRVTALGGRMGARVPTIQGG